MEVRGGQQQRTVRDVDRDRGSRVCATCRHLEVPAWSERRLPSRKKRGCPRYLFCANTFRSWSKTTVDAFFMWNHSDQRSEALC